MAEQHADLINRIVSLKKKKKAIVLAHNYQQPEVQEAADFVGDSLELARLSAKSSARIIVLCGVRFMAETAKILCPNRTVLMPVIDAGCPLAATISADRLARLKQEHPDAGVVTYVNSSAEVKALSDICCTSGNAVKVVKNAPFKKIIFVPDKNLGWWVSRNVPEKEIILWQGSCYVHQQYVADDLDRSRAAYPRAEVIVHPECPRQILEKADHVASTAGMLDRVGKSTAGEFIIGTEEGFLYRLQKENPAKKFYPLALCRICRDMKKTGLSDLLQCLEKDKFEIVLTPEIREKARQAIEEMIKYV